MEDLIKAALTSLLTAIKHGDAQTVVAETARLDEFLERGKAGLDPQLIHFLQNRSYAKALMLLNGDTDIPAGICGGRKR